MKKLLKILLWTLGALLALAIVAALLARFVFRDALVRTLHAELRRERVELLAASAAYRADTAAWRFACERDAERAREIGSYFRLDTLDDPALPVWERTLRIADFVASRIPHANQRQWPERCDAVSLWEYTRTVEPAFNCRLHALLLHELLWASGIANRVVTCLPQDAEDRDCHVVNQVWLPERGRWAMIDSDMGGCCLDEAGEPLSLAEMRRRCIASEPMTLRRFGGRNTDAAYYASYWAKNLYWFLCRERQGFGHEGCGRDGRSVALLPPGFEGFGPAAVALRTSDEERFWAAPDTDTL